MYKTIAYAIIFFGIALFVFAEMRHRKVSDNFLVFLFSYLIAAPVIGLVLIIIHQFMK